MNRSNEAFWWSLFSAGGILAALFMPAFIVLTGLVLPFTTGGDADLGYERAHQVVTWWPVRIVLFVVVFLSLFHCAHRIRHSLMDLGLRAVSTVLAALCYSGAAAGTIAALFVLGTL